MKRKLTEWRIILGVFFHYLSELPRLGGRNFIVLLRRLLLFLSKLKHNKYIKFGHGIRLDLYVPSYPGRAFFVAADKFKSFDGSKFRCASVLVSVTKACGFSCGHCYQRFDNGADTPLPLLVDTVRRLQDMGIAFFNIEGGEPFLTYDRLKAVCDAIDDRSEIWVNSTGMGMTLERLRELKIDAVMFSLHSHIPEKLNEFMGRDDAWECMERGVKICHEAGVPVTFNICLLKEAFYDGTFEEIMETAKKFGAALVQIIKPKPAGAWIENNTEFFSEVDIKIAVDKVNIYNFGKKCKNYPAVSMQILEECPDVFGCTAGGTDRFYLNAKGDVQPCEFLNISFGNINDEDFDIIYARMRKVFETPGNCMLCEKYSNKIGEIFTENKLDSLPLPPEYAKNIYENWDSGEETDLYKRAREIKAKRGR